MTRLAFPTFRFSFAALASRFLLVAFAGAFLAATTPALAQDFPELTGRVVDQADLLDPAQEGELTTKLAGLEAQSNRQLVVATVNSLDGYDIADYGYQLGRIWGIGQDGSQNVGGETEKDNGVLLLIAPNDRKVRIEVGYGLEGILTDALSSMIIQNDILPAFRNDDMAGGILAGVDRIALQLALPEDEARALAQQAGVRQQSADDGGANILVIFWICVIIWVVFSSMRSARRGGKRYRGGAGPVVIWGGGGSSWGSGSSSGGFGGGGFGGGGFSGGGGSFGGGGASGGW